MSVALSHSLTADASPHALLVELPQLRAQFLVSNKDYHFSRENQNFVWKQQWSVKFPELLRYLAVEVFGLTKQGC